jgi:hypothetical protein
MRDFWNGLCAGALLAVAVWALVIWGVSPHG